MQYDFIKKRYALKLTQYDRVLTVLGNPTYSRCQSELVYPFGGNNLLINMLIRMFFVSENGLTLEPHVLRAESSKASGIAVNCKRNTSDSTYEPNQRVIISHVTADGNTTKVASNGKLVDQSLSDKYEIINGTVEDFSQYILKIKSKPCTNSSLCKFSFVVYDNWLL